MLVSFDFVWCFGGQTAGKNGVKWAIPILMLMWKHLRLFTSVQRLMPAVLELDFMLPGMTPLGGACIAS